MRHPTAMIALVLALLSGFVLAQLWSMDPIRLRSIQAISTAQVEATTLAFYEGVNDYLEHGDDASLRRTLHPAFVNHQPGSSAIGTTEAFLKQLDSIRHVYPNVQLTPTVTPLSSNAASVALAWTSMDLRDFAGIEIDLADVIGALDIVRTERGLIVERWSSGTLTGQLDAYPALSIDLPVSIDTLVARVREFQLRSDYQPATNLHAHMLLIDLTGEAFLEVLRPTAVPPMTWTLNKRQVADPARIESANLTALNSMEAVFIPAGTTFRMWNAGDQRATFIVLEFGPPMIGKNPQGAQFLSDLKPTLWSGVELENVGNRLVLSFGQAQLHAGARLSSPSVEGLELTWVIGGTIDMTGTGGETRVRRADGLRSQLIEGHAVLHAGDAGVAGPGSDVRYWIPDGASSTIWFFSIVAASNSSTSNATEPDMGSPTVPAPPPVPSAR